MKKYLLSIILSALSLGLSGQNTQKITATKAGDYGLQYTLPVTVLDITVETETTVKEPGEFYKYAKKYLNVDDPIAKPSETTKVKSVIIRTHGEADQNRRYMMTFKGGVAPFIVINRENMPVSINSDKSFEQENIELPSAVDAKPTPLETEAARQVVTEEMLQSRSSAKRAELAAAQIYTLRQSRNDLITGQADNMPPDGKAMQIVMDNIEAQEAALVAMFLGTTKTYTQVGTFSYTPTDNVRDVVVARISSTEGIVGPEDLSGAPLFLSVEITERGKFPLNEKGETIPFPKNGVAYCIPGKAEVTVSFDGETVAEKRVDISQFGVDYGLNPASFTNKKEPAYVIFNPATGAIVEMGAKE